MESIFNSPNPILFGVGAAARTGLELQKLGCKKVLAVFDKGVEQAGVAEKVLKAIRDAGVDVVVYNNVQADPPVWSVEEAGALGVKEGIDGVVGIGGGSSLDTAKGA